MALLLYNGHILSCKEDSIVETSWIHLEDGLVKATGSGKAPSGLESVDLAPQTSP